MATTGVGGCLLVSARQLDVLYLLREGLPAKSIGRRLGISTRTVHRHLDGLYRALGVNDRLSAVLQAREVGILAE